MDNLPQIEEWRRTLTLTDRLKLNHPNAVLRKWKAFMKPENKPEPGAPPKPRLKDSVANLSEELLLFGFFVRKGNRLAATRSDLGFDAVDLIELTKWLKDTAGELKAQQRALERAEKKRGAT